VLSGNASDPAVARTWHSSGRVVEAGPSDRLFLYYSDHGAPGLLGMPSGDFVYADQLHAALKHRARRGGFREAVVYVEACESGSIFEGLLDPKLRIYATTAANGAESSWGTYCPGMGPGADGKREIPTCLGDLYSVAWMEDAEREAAPGGETLAKQYDRVRARVSANGTYAQGSHVERFGALPMAQEEACEFEGAAAAAPRGRFAALLPGSAGGGAAALAPQEYTTLPQREASLAPLMAAAARGAGTPAGAAAAAALAAERARRAALDAAVLAAVHGVVRAHAGASSALGGLLAARGGDARALAADAVAAPLARAPGRPVVDDWGCLRAMMGAWAGACGAPLDQDHGARHARAFANLCNAGAAPAQLRTAAAGACGAAARGAASAGA
jgi:legumain